jgi:hypothetical protein
MPSDALLLSLAVTAVFIGFAAVLGWADRQTRPAKVGAPVQRPQSVSSSPPPKLRFLDKA